MSVELKPVDSADDTSWTDAHGEERFLATPTMEQDELGVSLPPLLTQEQPRFKLANTDQLASIK